MEIAVISDIHSNSVALAEVLEKIYPKTDEILCCGDLVGYLPCVNEVFDVIREYDVSCVRGNHDQMVLNGLLTKNHQVNDAIIFSRKYIEKRNLNFLSKLPIHLIKRIDNLEILMMHGGPSDPLNQYVYHDDVQSINLENSNLDIVLLGHTHIPMICKKSNILIINPGSIGLPRDADPRSSYAIINSESDVKILKQTYDLNKISCHVSRSNLNYGLIPYLHMGCNLNNQHLSKNRTKLLNIYNSIKNSLSEYKVSVFSREILIESIIDSYFFSIIFLHNNNLIIRTGSFFTNGNFNEDILNEGVKSELINCGHNYFLLKRNNSDHLKLKHELHDIHKEWNYFKRLLDGKK